jgi:RNA polymerase sigma factor (TIGR02999 family)
LRSAAAALNSVVMSEVTRLIDAAAAGDPKAAAELLPLVYDELRQLAAARLVAEKPGQTLQATALVHEAYLRLIGPDVDQHWNSRGHFFAAAAESMRRILVDAARRKNRGKHGGGRRRVDLIDAPATSAELPDEPAKAELVKLRYFAGLALEEAADCQGISLATAKRRWAVARAWLYDALSPDDPQKSSPNS